MERYDPASLRAEVQYDCRRSIRKERSAVARKLGLPATSVKIFRDLGMSMDAIAAYFRRFPDLQGS